MLIPPVIFSFRSSSPSSHDHSSEAPRFVQTSLNNHNVVIFRCTAYSKASLERSFFYLNIDALFCENRTWNNGVVIVWRPSLAKPTHWTDGGHHFRTRQQPHDTGEYRRSAVLYCGNAQTPNRGQQSYKEQSWLKERHPANRTSKSVIKMHISVNRTTLELQDSRMML